MALAVAALAWGVPRGTHTKKKAKAPIHRTVTTARKTAAHKTVSASRKAPARKTTAARKSTPAKRRTSTAAARARRRTPVQRATWRNRQTAPTPERYQEIQNALVAKGYLQPSQADGQWDQASVDALKKFQAVQNLDANGKINSLSLIALGLGPRYDSLSVATSAAASGTYLIDPSGRR